jgi:hypothetical protein
LLIDLLAMIVIDASAASLSAKESCGNRTTISSGDNRFPAASFVDVPQSTVVDPTLGS